MPHPRPRHLRALLEKTLRYAPITGVFGHRQVGKTTLLGELASNYVTLDVADDLSSAEVDPFAFLSKRAATPLAIDECQYAPRLFPALKEWVRTQPKPGQFLLSGSVRFSSRKAIRESLTGRMIAWELLPMDFSEIHGAPLPQRLAQILHSKTLALELPPAKYVNAKAIAAYAESGGMPGVLFLRNDALRSQKFETQINTMLERDLKLVLQTSLSYRSLRSLVARLAQGIGEPLEWARLQRETRISAPTLRKLIAAFESIFLIRVIPTEGSQKKPVVFFEDAAEARYLGKLEGRPQVLLLSTLFSNLRPQIAYRPEQRIETFQYRNRDGALVPLCFRTGDRHLGIVPMAEDVPDASSIRSARSFVKRYPNAKALLVHAGGRDTLIEPQIRMLGIGQLL